MKIKYFGAVLITGLILFTGCSSSVNVQKDDSANFNNYHTYAWVDTRAKKDDQSDRATAFADISVRNAANAALQKKGWTEVSNGNADVLVSYDVLVERSSEPRSDAVYSQPFTRYYFNPYRRHWVAIYYPSYFLGYQNYDVPVKEGTITISMMDANTDKTVWQGWTTESMNYSRLTDDEIQSAVSRIMNKFKPKA